MMYLIVFYKRRKKDIINELKDEIGEKKTSTKDIVKMILKLSIPIAFGSIILSVSSVIDFATVMRGLKTFLPEIEANRQLGILQGKVDMLIGLPLSVNVAFAMVLVPTISAAIALKDWATARKRVASSLLFTLLIALPATIGLSIMADPILKMMFPNASDGAYILQISAFTIIFSAINQTLTGALQGLGDVKTPVVAILVGSLFKLALNLILVPIAEIGIKGAAFSSIISQCIMAIIMFAKLQKKTDLKVSFSKYSLKPMIATVIMAIVTAISYKPLLQIINSNAITTVVCLGIAVVSYGISVIVLKIFNKEEILLMPMGNKIYNVLTRLRVYRG